MAQMTPVPSDVAMLKVLDRVDYEDAFVAQTPASRTAEQWARLCLESDPPPMWQMAKLVSTEPRKPLSSQTRQRPETPGGIHNARPRYRGIVRQRLPRTALHAGIGPGVTRGLTTPRPHLGTRATRAVAVVRTASAGRRQNR